MPEQRWTIHVCPDCGEHITESEWSAERGAYWGHYHDPPEGWEGEDPWVDAVPITVVPSGEKNPQK